MGTGPLGSKVRDHSQQKNIINILEEFTQLVKKVKGTEKDTKKIIMLGF